MQSSGGAKNPPWARSNVNTNISGINPQIMDPNAMMGQQGIMPFQQGQAVFNPNMMQGQGGMAMPMTGQMPMNQMAQSQMYPGNVVAYPTPRALNPGIYQNTNANQASNNAEQRVFTGTVTKTHNDFGFVDHDVFYQTSVCAKGVIPKVNDRVLVEASYNPNMPFKWNATRVQVLPKGQGGPNQKNNQKSNNYNAVPPPNRDKIPMRRDDRMNNRRGGGGGGGRNAPEDRMSHKRSRTRSRSRSRDLGRRDSRARRDSPPRKRPVMHQPSPLKYMVRVPRIPLDVKKMDVPTISQRYNNLYIPSDFFNAHIKWGKTFPPQAPFTLNNPCGYHIMSKETENPIPNDAIFEPLDSDYRYSAKVMLISLPTLETLYQKCGLTKMDEKDKRNAKSPLHPTRLIKFLVGQKGKNGENFAIGGPWSPSFDGENPESDPKVLVKTAIRTCNALTGIDLSACTQWFRMVEFYYWREGSGGKSRLETVVLFLPDVWSAQASRIDWTNVQEQYKAAYEAALRRIDAAAAPLSGEPGLLAPDGTAPESTPAADKSQIDLEADNSTITIDENDEDDVKPEPSHYSKIDLRIIKAETLRQELRARNVSCKGLRSVLVSRLRQLLKAEEEKETKSDDIMEVVDDSESEKKEEEKESNEDHIEIKDDGDEEICEDIKEEKQDKKEDEKKDEPKKKSDKEIEEEKRKLEREKQTLKNRYEIPSQPHIIVHPCTTAKGGKFNASVASLSLLLDYRVTDNKEHSFELFVFAELFNEMLMRDFGFYIYKTLYTLPEKTEESKEKTDDKSEKKDDKKDDREKRDEKEKKDEKDKKDEIKESKDVKKDDKRDSRDSRRPGRERRDSHSDDERSSSPKRRSRGVELPPDPYLLLSLVYFDTTRGGYINKKDLQNLFMSLGLQLSRSQIRSIMEKVCVKEAFNYKALIQTIKDLSSVTTDAIQDISIEATGDIVISVEPPLVSELENTIATGNCDLLPVFNRGKKAGDKETSGLTKDVSDTGIVMYKSRVVDIGALVASSARNAAHRTRLEAALEAARAALRAARQAAASIQQAERGATTQLCDVSASLTAARARIASLTASSKIFHSALKSIQSKVEAVVNIKYEDDDVVEIVNGPKTPTPIKKDNKETDENAENNLLDTEESIEAIKEIEILKETKEPESTDNIATENMDLDDKE